MVNAGGVPLPAIPAQLLAIRMPSSFNTGSFEFEPWRKATDPTAPRSVPEMSVFSIHPLLGSAPFTAGLIIIYE